MATLQLFATAIDTLVSNEETDNEETDKKETDDVDSGVLYSRSPSNGLIEPKDCDTLHTLNHRLERDFKELPKLKRENKRLEAELRKSESMYEQERLTREMQETRLTELEQKLASANSKTRNCQENLEVLQRKLNQIELERERDQRQKDQLKQKCLNTKEELEKSKYENDNNRKEKERLQKNLAQYKAELKQKTEELQSDKAKLTTANKELNNQRSVSVKLRQEIDRYETLLDQRHLRPRDQVDSGDTQGEEVEQTETTDNYLN
ncbi:hypothetical protein Bpfe_007192 [Biomphalaria pfeifferi]|uniref:Uncharacterized protein n=1 Tax=Biomphalaria pfeifferi TaxID=112525 RepID=A0AAD8BZ81_BIOPF|nr:hypothetical protein Bpfe_007192 [Biomphalaria pfeifferi]